MDNRSLILLGLLMAQSQHGYQINEFIERNLSTITDMKKPTAYAVLDKLSQKGYIDVQMEQEGNRPPRKVYSINEKGRECFLSLLSDNLSSPEALYYEGDIGLMFLDHLPMDKVISAIERKLSGSEKILSELNDTPHHGKGIGVNLAVSHKKVMLETEIRFLEDSLEFLQNQIKNRM